MVNTMNNQQPTQQKDTIMEEFTFIEWTQHTIWQSERFTIEAETYEEAKEKFLSALDSGDEEQYSEGDFEYNLEDIKFAGGYELYDNEGNLLIKEQG